MSSTLTVGQIEDQLSRTERRIHTRLHDITVSDGGQDITVTPVPADGEEPESETFELDEVTERQMAEFLGVNVPYIRKCPAGLKAHNLNYWLHQSERETSEAILVAGPNGIETMHDPDSTIITIPEVAGVISRSFRPDDEIVTLISDPTKFHADIVVQRSSIIVPGNGVGDRPREDGTLHSRGHDPLDGPAPTEEVEAPQVFDITHGGVRILAYPNKAKAPVVERYFNRYICANGLTMPVPDRKITLRGNTVEEVLESMEEAAEFLLGTMDEQLERYKALSEVEVPGNPLLFIQQIGKEQGIPASLIQKALDYAGGYGFGSSDVQVTSYDVLQLFTALANEESVRYSTSLKLQRAGGLFVHRGDDLMHRCETCERPLVGG